MGSNARRPFGTTRAGGARGHSDDTSRTPAVAVAWLRTATASLALLTAAACSAQEPELLSVARHPSTATTVGFGAFTYGGVWQGMEPVLRLEAELGRRLDVVHWFTNWDNAYYPEMVEAVRRRPGAADQLAAAPAGRARHRRRRVRRLRPRLGARRRRRPRPRLPPPFPEMNGDWVPWNGDPDGLRAAWRHVAASSPKKAPTTSAGSSAPTSPTSRAPNDNRMERYYPGDDVVDVLALSGYNWGATRPYIGWRSFEEIFDTAYERITALGDQQPLWLAEIASSDEGGDKAAWVRDMFASTAFPRLEMVVWFDEDKEADWRVTSHPEVVQAFRDALDSAEVSASLR
jgi:hypothetical protein